MKFVEKKVNDEKELMDTIMEIYKTPNVTAIVDVGEELPYMTSPIVRETPWIQLAILTNFQDSIGRYHTLPIPEKPEVVYYLKFD